jgi:hypothetical protein
MLSIRQSVPSAFHNSTIRVGKDRKVNFNQLRAFDSPLIIPSKLVLYHSESDKDGYFKQVADARQLQARFMKETGIDIVSRVARAGCGGLRVACAHRAGG